MAVVRFRPSLSLREARAFFRALPGADDALVGELERRFSDEFLEGRRVILAPSGRIALYWILKGMHVSAGDEVVTQAFNFAAVPAAIQAAGATPRFVDLEPDGFNLDPLQLQQIIGPGTRAVLLTHLFGNPANIGAVRDLCRANGVELLEDCGQATGATYHGRPVGTFSLASLFTFGATKNFTLLGGGAAATGDGALAQRMEELAGRHPRICLKRSLKLAAVASGITAATSPLVFNLAVHPGIRLLELVGIDPVHRVMDEPAGPLIDPERSPRPSRFMAGVGLEQLGRYQRLNQARVRNGWYLHQRLVSIAGITVPRPREGCIFMSFPIFHPRRKDLARELRRRGVDTDLGFMEDCSALPLFGGPEGHFPNSVRAASEIVHLPVHPGLREADLQHIVAAVRESVKVVGK